MTQANAEAVCRSVYREAFKFFGTIPRSPDYGYKLLNSPPVYGAEILFIGYQPGGNADDPEVKAGKLTHEHWPDSSEYLTGKYPLARNIRSLFAADVAMTKCVGLNAIFLRYPRVAAYSRGVDRPTQRAIRNFCLPQVTKIADALEPRKIAVIGLSTLKLFGQTTPDIRNENGRVLTTLGHIGNREAIAVLHLSGARISTSEREMIRNRVLAF